MTLVEQTRLIGYVKSHAREVFKELRIDPGVIINIEDGEAKMVVVDVRQFERQQETLALLKRIALSRKEFAEGKFSNAVVFMEEMDG
jgi:hypothetical protein